MEHAIRSFITRAGLAVSIALLSLAGVVSDSRPVQAGGFTACEYPFVFEGSAANIVPLEYLATSADVSSGDGDRLAKLQKTARRFSWLFKLDSWHQPTYGSLGVVAHMFLDGVCDPDVVLDRLLSGGASQPLREGQILVFLQGRIFLEEDQIFVQSRLRGFRRLTDQYEAVQPLSNNFAEEFLHAYLGQSGEPMSISIPALDVTFAPRVISEELFRRIDITFIEASKVYSSPDLEASSDELLFEPNQRRAFSVEIGAEPGWIKVDDMFGGHPNQGYIRINPEASHLFHSSLPELDFLNGALGFLRLRQNWLSDEFPPVSDGTAQMAQAALERYLENELTLNEPELRALAHALIGFIQASEEKDWMAARVSFLEAATLSPTDTHYRNALGVTDAMLCCSHDVSPPYRDPARWFADALSVNPENGESLSNLLHFLEYLNETNQKPDGIDTTNLPTALDVVRKVADQNPELMSKGQR